MSVKISIIGAGSAVFSLRLVIDLCLTPNLEGSTISFMDIDENRLNAIHHLCQRYSEEAGNKLILEKTTDRRESLKGADFVINTALAAGHDRLRAGWDIARAAGYRMGGSLHVMHDEAFWINYYQFKLFDSVMQDVLELCPNAWYLMVDNPVLAGITYMGRKYPQAKIVGLCHGFSAIYKIADLLGLDRDHLTFQIPGVNHFVWATHIYHKGQDVFPLLDQWIENESAKYWETSKPSDYMGPVAVDLYKRFGVFPIGDTCNPGGGSWPYWYHVDDATEARWHESPSSWYADYFGSLAGNIAKIKQAVEGGRDWGGSGRTNIDQFKQISDDTQTKVTDVFPPKLSGEVMVPMIEALACDIPRVLVGNIPNSGDFVPGVPRNFAVEIPTLVSKRGIQGIKTDGLPEPLIAHILRDRVASIAVELEAYETGSRTLLEQLVLMDPYTRSQEQAHKLVEDILALPFHEEMRQHYR